MELPQPGKRYPWWEQGYNENLDSGIPFALSRSKVDYWIPEATQHPGLPAARQGDLVSPVMFYRRRVADPVGIQTNARRY